MNKLLIILTAIVIGTLAISYNYYLANSLYNYNSERPVNQQ